jgi:hypothetical protein
VAASQSRRCAVIATASTFTSTAADLSATDRCTLRRSASSSSRQRFDLKVKNYNDLAHKTLIPRVLVVFLLPKDASQWLTCTEEALVLRRSAYWLSLHGLPPTQKVSTARVHLPRTQVFDTPCVHRLLERVAREEAITP